MEQSIICYQYLVVKESFHSVESKMEFISSMVLDGKPYYSQTIEVTSDPYHPKIISDNSYWPIAAWIIKRK